MPPSEVSSETLERESTLLLLGTGLVALVGTTARAKLLRRKR
jgi:hypothetical protein